jgi:hypothetical protein
MTRQIITYGAVPVPYVAVWSDEEAAGMLVADCPHSGRPAVCNVDKRGSGRPVFGKPHMGRQREVIAKDMCDLCARPLKGRTRVSLSHAKAQMSGNGLFVMQVEAMMHKECALTSMKHCPSLKRDIKAGTLHVRQVLKYRVLFAQLTRAAVAQFCGKGQDGVVGHAKVELLKWKDRDLAWLEAAGAE